MKFSRVIFLFTSIISFSIVFLYDIIKKVVTDVGGGGGDLIHVGLILLGFASTAVYVLLRQREVEINPVKIVGKVTIIALCLITLMGVITLTSMGTFNVEDGAFIPKNYGTLIVASILSIFSGITSIIVFIELSKLIFIKRRRNTKRNYLILLITGSLYLFTSFLNTFWTEENEFVSGLSTALFIILIIAFCLNSFRLSWIVYLSRKEKLYSLIFSFFGLVLFIMITIFSHETSNLLHQSLLYYYKSLHAFVSSVMLFAAIYTGIGFASTLFQLPTAEAFDKKKSEITSLHTMSRLITQVLDYDELLATTINLALDVSEGDGAWINILPQQKNSSSLHSVDHFTGAGDVKSLSVATIVTSKNIEKYDIGKLLCENSEPLESLVYNSKKSVIIHDFSSDRRVRHLKNHRKNIGSLVMIPLMIPEQMLGVLCIVKNISYGFDKDILNVVYAFTDLVTAALENNKLIGQSIVKERLEQELMVAQQMQQKLLPQKLPEAPEFEMCAISLPAYEVGGDYYDVVKLNHKKIGLVIGDVSGKGVSAALLMAQVKGIFQSLCMQASTTKELLIKTNAALYGNIERKSFVSLLYAMIDLESGTLSFSRAGHCPILRVQNTETTYLRPDGMGVGLDNSHRFIESIKEQKISLQKDDLIILYTDGITEAKNSFGEEYGYKKLSEVVKIYKDEPPTALMHLIIKDVKTFTGGGAAEDDITLIVLKWKGSEAMHISTTHELQPSTNMYSGGVLHE